MTESLDALYVSALPELTNSDRNIIAFWNHITDPSPLSKSLFLAGRQLVDGMAISIVLEWLRQHRDEGRARGAVRAAALFDQLWRRNVEAVGGDPDEMDRIDDEDFFGDSTLI